MPPDLRSAAEDRLSLALKGNPPVSVWARLKMELALYYGDNAKEFDETLEALDVRSDGAAFLAMLEYADPVVALSRVLEEVADLPILYPGRVHRQDLLTAVCLAANPEEP